MDRRAFDYTIIGTSRESDILENMVVEAILDGWEPLGGVAVSTTHCKCADETKVYLYQAMARYAE